MELLKSSACYAIDDNEQHLKELSYQVWTFAEPGGKEVNSCAALCKYLKEHQFTITKYKGLATSFKAEWGEKEHGGAKRPNIGFLCRYDAHPKHGHIKGNNLVAAVTIGAAIGVKQAIRAASSKIGKVTVIGCPNSAQNWLIYLLNWKMFIDVDIVLSAIPGPQTVWSPVYLGSKTFRSRYKYGSQERTEMYIPATEALTASVYALSNILSVQEHFVPGWKAPGIVSDGGKNPAEPMHHSDVTVGLSGETNIDLAILEKRVVPCLEAAAIFTRCSHSIEVASKTIYCMMNNVLLGYCLQLNAYCCGVLSTPLKPPRIVLDPVDMGNLSYFIPAIRPMYYIGTDHKVGSLAFRDDTITSIAHIYTVAMAKALAMTAIDVMITPGTLLSIKEEHRESVRKVKDVKFEPFAYSKAGDPSQVSLPVSPDFNTGWSNLW